MTPTRLLAATALLMLLAACAGTTPSATPTPTAPAQPALRLLLASTDLAIGPNRVAFALVDDATGPLRQTSGVSVSTYRLTAAGQEGPIESVDAVYRQWSEDGRGAYTARLNFDRAGDWGLGVAARQPGGVTKTASARVPVRETSLTPALGSPAPRTQTKTFADVMSMAELTTDPQPDAELYAVTIAGAISESKPLVVVFATPAYCATATCGPQLDAVKRLKAGYADRANFIHVEVYDNPHRIEGDLSNAKIAPAVAEWRLPSEPWTFVIDAGGLVAAKFEGYATLPELEEALAAVAGP